jgi:hypothetical protein
MTGWELKLLKEGGKWAMKKAVKYLRDDLTRQYGLAEEVKFFVRGKDICGIMRKLESYTTKDGSLSIDRNGEDGIVVSCHPFKPEANLWNGPDVLPDKTNGAMEASLAHDLIWYHASELAEAFGCTRTEILHWGNGVLYAIWLGVSGPSFLSRVSYGICELVAPFYHAAKKKFLKTAFAAALGFGVFTMCGGCSSFNPPEWNMESAEGLEFISAAITGHLDQASASLESPLAQDDVEGGKAPSTETDANPLSANDQQITQSGDEMDFAQLDWTYGGFNGKNASPVNGCRISTLVVGSHSMSYKWEDGGCELLGAADRGDYNATMAALFVLGSDGIWRGGKFDWVSTSRTSRSFENIEVGYHGWPEGAILDAAAYAFVIVGKDGKRRSNVIVSSK